MDEPIITYPKIFALKVINEKFMELVTEPPADGASASAIVEFY